MDKTTLPLDGVLDELEEAVVALDPDGFVRFCNRAAEQLLPVLASPDGAVYFPDLAPELGLPHHLAERNWGALHNRKLVVGERAFSAKCFPLAADPAQGLALVLRDITDLRLMAKDLGRATEEKTRLESFLDILQEGVIVTDTWGVVIAANRAVRGFVPADAARGLPGRKIGELFECLADLANVPSQGVVDASEDPLLGEGVVVSRTPLRSLGRLIGYVIALRRRQDEPTAHAVPAAVAPPPTPPRIGQPGGEPPLYTLDDMVGQGKAIQHLKVLCRKIAKTNSTVLIQSESGTGKELLAHALHNLSARADAPFLKLNCASLPDTLLESEMFGYDEGAFTGAKKGGSAGRFELANGGTLFLDEIGEMSLSMQAKLLRVLQEKEFQRLGGQKPRRVDVRVVCATNRPLAPLIDKQLFREDLYYRINVINLSIPPLRERREDIKSLVIYYIRKYSHDFQKRVRGISPGVYSVFMNHAWPGNVRELSNVIEYAFNVVDGELIDVQHLPLSFLQERKQRGALQGSLRRTLDECAGEAVVQALRSYNGNKTLAAKALGISRASLYRKLGAL